MDIPQEVVEKQKVINKLNTDRDLEKISSLISDTEFRLYQLFYSKGMIKPDVEMAPEVKYLEACLDDLDVAIINFWRWAERT